MRKLEGFYNREDVQRILGCGINKAYLVMQDINGKLKEQGYTVLRGYVSKKVFKQTYNI